MSKYNFELNLDADNSHTKILKKILPGSVVLEFGPAHGVMTKYMREILNCTVYAVELDNEAALDAEKYCKEIIVGSIEVYSWKQAFSDIKFDYVLFADVLEHLYDPWRVLTEVRGFLKPEGRSLISLPNVAHNAIIMNLMRDKFEYKSTGLLDNTHIRFFTRSSIEEMIINSGYKIVDVDTVDCAPENTEFRCQYLDFDDSVADSLLQKPNGHVYQYIYDIANKESRVPILISGNIDKAAPDFPENSHMQLFYYQSDEVNVLDVRTFYFADDIQTKFSFELINIVNLTHIRVDLTNFPVVANLEYVKLIFADGSEHLLQPCYSNANFIEGNSYTYLHDDPINVYYLTPLNLQHIARVEVAVDLQPIKKSEILALANQITTKQNEKIIQLESICQQTQQQLQQAHQLNPWSHAVVALHYDIGQDFNAEHYLQQAAQVGLKHYEFSLSEIAGIKGVRLDPLNLPAHIKLISAQIVTKDSVFYPLSVAWHNANHLAENRYSFYHDDPIWIFDWSSLGALDYDKVVLEFELELIEVHELSNFVVQQLAVFNTKEAKLSSTQAELSSTQAELSSTQAELSST
ncbi:MAG: class I SAM-dependent methyltransferase, partial [Burkholderiales bacterium]|nr:class I SAM-dependent methyltransferase [Burkholderiales bacterium]